MSPKRKAVAAGEYRAHPEAHNVLVRASIFKGEDEEVKADNNAEPTQEEKLLELMKGLAEHMERLEESQDKRERIKEETSVFGFALGQGQAMNRRTLDMTPPRAPSPAVSPGTYFGFKQQGYAEAAANVEMAQAPHRSLPQPAYRQAPQQMRDPEPYLGQVANTRERN